MEPNENRMDPILPEESDQEIKSADSVNDVSSAERGDPEQNTERRAKPSPFYSLWVLITAMLVCIAVLLTFTLTSATLRKYYRNALVELSANPTGSDIIARDAVNLQILETVLRENSFYSDSLNDEEMLQAAFKAYVEASGDRYAVFYTEAEYLAMMESSSGNYVGIGITVTKDTRTIDGEETVLLHVESAMEGSSAYRAGIRVGDDICSVRVDGAWKTVTQLGYDATVSALRGEEGTSVELMILREGETIAVTCTRERLESISVTSEILASDPTVAVIRISEFRLNTPTQFCREVDACRAAGADKFVFDVRDNPGGDLRSIRAVLSNFLQKGDLILAARDKDGKTTEQMETRCAVVSYYDDSAECSVTAKQIGQYRNLNFVVLCNEKTASAAEVFTATLRDHGLSKATVGVKTFGKGIMQSVFEIPFRGIKGYIKLTTYEYVTQSGYPDGQSYHGYGIMPDVQVERRAGTESKPSSELSWDDDNQLQTAVAKLTAGEA